jgi:hypothetical protein
MVSIESRRQQQNLVKVGEVLVQRRLLAGAGTGGAMVNQGSTGGVHSDHRGYGLASG